MCSLKTNLIARRELHAQSNLSPVNFAKFTLELIMQTFEDFSLSWRMSQPGPGYDQIEI